MEAEVGQGQKATLKLTGIPLKMVVVHHPSPPPTTSMVEATLPEVVVLPSH